MEYTIDALTPPAILDIIKREYKGGMVQAVIVGVEVVTAQGERRNLFAWDQESSITIQLGLASLLAKGLDLRSIEAFCDLPDLPDLPGFEDFEE